MRESLPSPVIVSQQSLFAVPNPSERLEDFQKVLVLRPNIFAHRLHFHVALSMPLRTVQWTMRLPNGSREPEWHRCMAPEACLNLEDRLESQSIPLESHALASTFWTSKSRRASSRFFPEEVPTVQLKGPHWNKWLPFADRMS